MGEIKFRGYDADSKCWRYGSYFCYEKDKKENEHHLIIMNGFSDWNLPRPHYQSEVVGETVGQYTGLRDINSKEVYEGDILQILVDTENGYEEIICTVVWDNDCLSWMIENKDGSTDFLVEYSDNIANITKVIGNIHENPELLEVEE